MGVHHYENFPVASLLLPRKWRNPVAQIYRFARDADDFADEGNLTDDARLQQLERFRTHLRRIERGEPASCERFGSLDRLIRHHRLPVSAFFDLLSAFCQDVTRKRYADFTQLADYCRRSANPIGRLLLNLFGHATPANLEHSDAICSALQLVNFWQDVEIDYAKNRIYLPQDEMQAYGVTEQHIASRQCDDAWRDLMKFQVDRARAMLESGAPLGRALPGRIGLEIRATVHGGLRILEKLERAHYDVFRQRPVLKWHDWPRLIARAL
jgi:squalene synthase HpnC